MSFSGLFITQGRSLSTSSFVRRASGPPSAIIALCTSLRAACSTALGLPYPYAREGWVRQQRNRM